MGVVAVALIFASLLPVAQFTCSCGKTLYPLSTPIQYATISSPQDDVTHHVCAMECTYTVVYTGSDPRNLSPVFGFCDPATNNEELLTFYNGNGTSGTVLATTDCSSGEPSVNPSSVPSVTIVLNVLSPNPATPADFIIYVSTTTANLPTTTTTTTTTTTQLITTPSYNSSCDASQAQMDIAVFIDISGAVNSTIYSQMIMFVETKLLSLQDIQPNNSMKTQVTTGIITPLCYRFDFSEPWAENSAEFSTYFDTYKQSTIQTSSCYSQALTTLGTYVLTSQSSQNPLRRNNAPALLYLLTASGIVTEDVSPATNSATAIKNAGIRIMTVEIGSPTNSIAALATPGLNFSYPDVDSLMLNGMQDFVENVTCNGNNFCGGCGMPEEQIDNQTPVNFTLVTSPDKYCNFMSCNWTFTAKNNFNASVTFYWFDVEFQSDFIEVYDGNGNGLAQFSGYNTKGGMVTAGTSTIVVRFTSNSHNVYTGFQGSALGVQSSSVVRLFGESLPNP